MLKRLAASIREYKKKSILTPLLVSVEVVMECLIPFIIATLVTEVEGKSHAGFTYWVFEGVLGQTLPTGSHLPVIVFYGCLLVLMAGISLLFGTLAGMTGADASCGFAKNLRHDLFEKVQSFSFSNVDRFSSASLVTRLTTDVANVQMAYMMLIRVAVRCPFMLIFSMVMAFVMGGKMALIFVAVVPFLGVVLFSIIHKVMPLFRRVFRKYDRLNESIEENIRGMRVVKSFVREDYEKEKFDAAASDVKNDFTRAEKILALNGPTMQLCLNTVMIFTLLFGSYLIIDTLGVAFNVGKLSALLTYGFQILFSLMMVSMVFVTITMSLESARRLSAVLEEEPAIQSPDSPLLSMKDGSIDFEEVSFRYSETAEKNALEGVNLHIASGETVGILGGTGTAKTTLIQLISRLYDVTEGRVLVGGEDVKRYDLTFLRNSVAVVLQKNLLFSGTVKENLRWGNPDATDEELIEACKMAEAHEFVSAFPNGYDTYIEQGGSNVSGGQKQRLCIARALLKKPKILILDDSTSAVDTKTDAMIRGALKTYMPETTKIIIAQRVASVMDADKILWMEGGRIAYMGTHEELLATSAEYRETYESQCKTN
ncbi:MAG: ABC transporter ATP-binding protein [Clostridia bacterium]|nr:ABC transporter ATP-binding protein [Clostridia bacterium]